MENIDKKLIEINERGYNIPFIEGYSHLNGDCYKFLNPFTKYKKDKIVLCRIEDGFEKALDLQLKWMNEHIGVES